MVNFCVFFFNNFIYPCLDKMTLYTNTYVLKGEKILLIIQVQFMLILKDYLGKV